MKKSLFILAAVLLYSCSGNNIVIGNGNDVDNNNSGQNQGLIVFKAEVTTQAATDVTTSSAVLHASYEGVDEEFAPQEAVFRYGTDASSLTNVVAAQQDVNGPSGTFSASIKELTNGQTYYFQASMDAWNPVRKKYVTVTGKVISFTTEKPQEVTSGTQPGWAELPAMDVKQNGSYKISASDDNLYYAWHFSPDVYGPGNKPARNYTVCFSAEDHCPLWVAAPRHSMYVGSSGRNDSYRADPDIPSDLQYNSKSTGGGCNKGHMLGSAERTCSVETNRQVFYYSNIAPQLSSGFNTGGGGWNLLEDYMDSQVCRDTLYEVVGCYFDKYTDGYGETATPDKISFGGRNDVSIPTMFYYAVLRTKKGNSGKSVKDCSASELQCVAFVRTHTNNLKGQKPSSRELMSISDLEKITGFTYFTNVPNAPKSTYSASDWGL